MHLIEINTYFIPDPLRNKKIASPQPLTELRYCVLGGQHFRVHGQGHPENRIGERPVEKIPLSQLIPKGEISSNPKRNLALLLIGLRTLWRDPKLPLYLFRNRFA